MKNSKVLLAAVPVLIFTMGISSVSAFSENVKKGRQDVNRPDREAVIEVLENNDYEAFLELHAEGIQITEETFAKMVDLHEAIESDDLETAADLKAELQEIRESQREEIRAERESKREIVELALESGDFDAFVSAMEGNDEVLAVVTEDNFSLFVEMHEARESGDIETVKEIADELGLERPKGNGMKIAEKMGQRVGEGMGENDGRRGQDGIKRGMKNGVFGETVE